MLEERTYKHIVVRVELRVELSVQLGVELLLSPQLDVACHGSSLQRSERRDLDLVVPGDQSREIANKILLRRISFQLQLVLHLERRQTSVVVICALEKTMFLS